MADQPQNPTSPNSGRISSMLSDLAAQRNNASGVPPTAAARPAPIAVGRPAPVNLPTVQAGLPTGPQPVAPRPVEPAQPRPLVEAAAPMAPKPPVPAPLPASQPSGAILPTRPNPPPAPREIATIVPPRPATPPPPPPPAPVRLVPPAPQPPVTPPTPAVGAVTSELRTMSGDIGQIQIGQAPQGVRPVTVAPPPVRTPVVPVQLPRPVIPAPLPQFPAPSPIIIPPPSSGGGGKKILFVFLALIVLAIVAVTVWSMLGSDDGLISQPTPTPSALATVTPRQRALTAYFGLPKALVALSSDDTAATDFRNSLLTAEPPAKQGLGMEVSRSGAAVTPGAFLKATMGTVPVELVDSLGGDWVALAYGQTEAFDDAGQLTSDNALGSTLALVIEVTDASKANQAMQAWEGTGLDMAGENLFGYVRDNALAPGFNSGTYREVALRFRNFPYADHSMDWALTLASNGKNYLILTGSRESAFFVIDQLNQ